MGGIAHTFTNLLTHIIFSTKDREPFISDAIRDRLFGYMGGILNELHVTPILINGPTDHVHILAALPPKAALSDVMRVLKTNSSRWVHEELHQQFAWQSGYGAFSVSHSNAEQVRLYIANQQEHHKTVSFQEEFIAFLKRHEIPYDPRYIWE